MFYIQSTGQIWSFGLVIWWILFGHPVFIFWSSGFGLLYLSLNQIVIDTCVWDKNQRSLFF